MSIVPARVGIVSADGKWQHRVPNACDECFCSLTFTPPALVGCVSRQERKKKKKKTPTAVVNVSVKKPEPEVTVNMLSKEKPNDHFFRCQSALCECVRARSHSGCEVCNLFVVRSDLQACCLMNILILN